jgi:exo-beta-1,3-glucanase (GH17 family)
MKPRPSLTLSLLLLATLVAPARAEPPAAHARDADPPLHCVAFSPYVDGLNPDWGPHPTPALIGELLDRLVADTPFRCLMAYGVLPELEPIYTAARARGIEVIAILWLDEDPAVNSRSIASGIRLAREYRDVIVRLACGSEVRTRHGRRLDGEIERCLAALHEAGVPQPVTTIDTWWEWCDAATPCQRTRFADRVDWIGINIFPWWENLHSGLFGCTGAGEAAAFHLARIEEVRRAYPDKEVIVTEFGWPAGPPGPAEPAGGRAACAEAGPEAQLEVVNRTLAELVRRGWSGVVFQAFREPWKAGREGAVGPFWGLCEGTPPYRCPEGIGKPLR